MKLPNLSDAIKALIIALLLAVAGYVLFPLFGLSEPREAFTIALALGAFIGVLLSRLGRAAVAKRAAAPAGAEATDTTTLFVGNLAFKTSPEELRELFAPYGTVHSLRIMKDRATRRPRGFAFVEIDSKQAGRAIKALDNLEFHGRRLRLNTANKDQTRAS